MSDRVMLGALAALVVALLVASLVIGPAGLGTVAGLEALVGRGSPTTVVVMQEIRLPRALLGFAIGATLGLAGTVMQGYLRNPLADPGILGVSASASLGAVLAIYTGLAGAFPLALPLLAVAGSVGAVAVLHALVGRHASTLTLLIAGVGITSVAGALTALALNLSPNPFAALEIVFWMMGSLVDRSMDHVWLALPFMLAGWVMLATLGRALDALSLGPDVARSMGVSLPRTQALAVLGTSLSVGAATAVAGTIGFVGLVVPHLMRPLFGAKPSRLLAASALGGAAVVLAADVAVRILAPDRDLKLGVLTALVGAPFFLWLVLKHRRSVV